MPKLDLSRVAPAVADHVYVRQLEADNKRLRGALDGCLVAFAEVNPRPEDYQAVSYAANLLKRLGEQ